MQWSIDMNLYKLKKKELIDLNRGIKSTLKGAKIKTKIEQ